MTLNTYLVEFHLVLAVAPLLYKNVNSDYSTFVGYIIFDICFIFQNMSETKRIVYAIIKFLRNQLNAGELSMEGLEGVEVAIQCLESAYDISINDTHLDTTMALEELVQSVTEVSVQTFSYTHFYKNLLKI